MKNTADIHKLVEEIGVLEALLFASGSNTVVHAIMACATRTEAQRYLERLGMTTLQCDAVLAMPASAHIEESRNMMLDQVRRLRTEIASQ